MALYFNAGPNGPPNRWKVHEWNNKNIIGQRGLLCYRVNPLFCKCLRKKIGSFKNRPSSEIPWPNPRTDPLFSHLFACLSLKTNRSIRFGKLQFSLP